MAEREINLELLLGRRVFGESGKAVGRLEEVQAEVRQEECVVTEFHVGSYAVFERLSAYSIGQAILRLFGATKEGGGYRVPWDKLDLSDPQRPRLLCSTEELKSLETLNES
jgi:sporulation protein YlmC with PRC-barrel domain